MRVGASVLASPVRHPDHPDVALWLVVAHRTSGTPWYRLPSELVDNEAQAGSVVLAYARRWQSELAWKTCKSELGMQSLRVWDRETRLKRLRQATLAYAFLISLLTEAVTLLRRWLFRYTAHPIRLAETPRFSSRGGSKSSFFGAGDAWISAGGTSRVLQRNNLMGRQSVTFAVCVSRLFV
jgi:hypothetical protein